MTTQTAYISYDRVLITEGIDLPQFDRPVFDLSMCLTYLHPFEVENLDIEPAGPPPSHRLRVSYAPERGFDYTLIDSDDDPRQHWALDCVHVGLGDIVTDSQEVSLEVFRQIIHDHGSTIPADPSLQNLAYWVSTSEPPQSHILP